MRRDGHGQWRSLLPGLGFLLAAGLLGGIAGAAPGDNPVEDWVRYSLGELDLARVECGGEASAMIRRCADAPRTFSRFKAMWDSVQGRFGVPGTVESLEAWTRRQRVYERDYEVNGVHVHVRFVPGGLEFEYDPDQLQDLGYLLEPESDVYVGQPRELPKLAGFGGVTRPEVIEPSRVEPVYPAEALASMLAGEVRLTAIVLADGTLGEATVVGETPAGHGFGKSALDAVQWWRFRPAMLDGEPVDAETTLTVEFDPKTAVAAEPAEPGGTNR